MTSNATLPLRRRAMRPWPAALAIAALIGLAGFAPAASAKADEIVMASSGVTYVTGGAGTEAVDRLRAMEKDFNLKLVFALGNGEYLADVDVSVVDAANRVVLDTSSEGPWLLARLPAGNYQVNANYHGSVERRAVAVGATTLRTIDFRWPSE
jgi:hypothetical protein